MKKFRENELNLLYPNHDLKNKYILWVDFNVLYPYECSSARCTIILGGQNVVYDRNLLAPGKLLVQNATVLCHTMEDCWFKASQTETTSGIPFIFTSLEKLKKVEKITCLYSFDYQNAQGKRCRSIVYCAKKLSFVEKEVGTGDFCVKFDGTAIPALLEKRKAEERKNIISKYDEVIQILIKDCNDSKVQVNTNAIKISIPQEEYSVYLSQKAAEDTKKWGHLKDCDTAVINLYLSNGVYVVCEEDAPKDIATMFTIK